MCRTKCTPEVQAIFVEAFEAGHSDVMACEAAGIDDATFYRWLERGATGKAPYREFREGIKKAKLVAKQSMVQTILAAASDPKYWTAAAWWLERRFPAEWGKKEAGIPPPSEEAMPTGKFE